MPDSTDEAPMSEAPLDEELKVALASLPHFSRLDPATVPAAVATVIADNERGIEALLVDPETATWDSVCARLDELNDRLNRLWSPIRHLHSVADTDALRAAYAEAMPKVVQYGTAQMQNTVSAPPIIICTTARNSPHCPRPGSRLSGTPCAISGSAGSNSVPPNARGSARFSNG